MAIEYSVEVCNKLAERFQQAGLHRPPRITRYDAGIELVYDVTSVEGANTVQVHLVIEKFVGGGFAGQVYQVKVLEIESRTEPITCLQTGGIYAMKILIPPSNFARIFRNTLYWIGFQGPFQLQVNPAAARAGAIWQKFIRKGAQITFGNDFGSRAVADIHATFVDENLGSCGELSEWIDGHTWRLEVDERLDLLKQWKNGKNVDQNQLGSPEYRAKKQFMSDFVKFLHNMGAYEFARQYEWSTCKSQPNCLKRYDTDNDPASGLVAVDFRAGLALLPFLPMSPGDFKLIGKGFARGSIVQFDRGDINKLQSFVDAHSDSFTDMSSTNQMLDELKTAEEIYRNSTPDITHNYKKLFYSSKLWETMFSSVVTGWRVRNLISRQWEYKLRNSKTLTILFFIAGVIPFLGKFLRRVWGRPDWQEHYKAMLTIWPYFKRSIRAKMMEKAILWHRAGRINETVALNISESILLFSCHLLLSLLPIAGLHRLLTDFEYAKQRLAYLFVRPIKLYFNAPLREKWLRQMVADGQKKHILTDEDADTILMQINEPFIQKYLKSLAVHVCTLPVTQIVSITIALIYYFTHPEDPHAFRNGLAIVAFFQITPISPGSICRGLYVVYMAIKDRSFKDYNIALFLGFFKYVGYLAFPIQMTYRYPALARFMAAHWATEAVHIVPVFGERGALLEHSVFCWFYNWPLTIRRRMRRRAKMRTKISPRYRHVGLCALATAGIFGVVDFIYINRFGEIPRLREIWFLSLIIPLFFGRMVTLGCGGAVLWKRFACASICGCLAGGFYTIFSVIISYSMGFIPENIIVPFLWRIFVFAVLSAIGAILTELELPDPDILY